MDRCQAHPIGAAVHVHLDGDRRHGRRHRSPSPVRSLRRSQAAAAARNHHLDDNDRTSRDLAVSTVPPRELAAPSFGLPDRSRLGGTARPEHPATTASGLHPRLEPRGAPLLCDPAPRPEAARRGTSSTRSTTPALTLARAARFSVAAPSRPDRTPVRPPVHAAHRGLDTFEVMTTGTRRAVACV
jgi:hypothetical protein